MKLASKLAALSLGTIAASAALAGCGSSAPAHAPMASYGMNGACYYVYSPQEAYNLMSQGLCAANAPVLQAPQSWLDEYYYYYDSPLYYDTFVPPMYRHYYRVTYMPNYYRHDHARIAQLSRRATYYAANGKKVTNVTSTAKFGSGSSFGSAGQRYGSGNLRSRTTAPKATTGVQGNPSIPGATSRPTVSSGSKKTFGGGTLRGKKSTSSGKKR